MESKNTIEIEIRGMFKGVNQQRNGYQREIKVCRDRQGNEDDVIEGWKEHFKDSLEL